MGGKGIYCHQPTLRLRRDDGELLEVALDENTQVQALDAPAVDAEAPLDPQAEQV